MNNLGCIYLKKDQFENSFNFLDEAIRVQDDILLEEKGRNEMGDKDRMSMQLVLSCRHYNKALACQRFINKIIQDYLPIHSLSQFVKRIPDKYEGP
jgi:Lhr-like helicase